MTADTGIHPEGMECPVRIRIDLLPASPELDILVGERVMGWEHQAHGLFVYYLDHVRVVCKPKFSSSITEAWEVVKKVVNLDHDGMDYWFQLTFTREQLNPIDHRILIRAEFNKTVDRQSLYGYGFSFIGEADTAPLAICRAALKVVST